MAQTTQSLKLYYQGNYYRRTFSSPVTYLQIRDEITSTITHSDLFYLQYIDNEGDTISLCSDMELEELAQLSLDSPLRIDIIDGIFQLEPNSSQNNSTLQSNTPQEPPTEQEINEMNKFLEEQGYNKINADLSSDELVDHNIQCKQCSKKILGTRWLCSVCPSFDLCQCCEAQHDRAHPLVRIVEPISRSSEAVYSLCSSLQQSKERLSNFNSYASEFAHSLKTDLSLFVCSLRNHTIEAASGLVEKAQKIPTSLHLVKAKEEPQDFYTSQKEKFEKLEELGFCDRERNELLLIMHEGDLNACLDHLLNPDKVEVD